MSVTVALGSIVVPGPSGPVSAAGQVLTVLPWPSVPREADGAWLLPAPMSVVLGPGASLVLADLPVTACWRMRIGRWDRYVAAPLVDCDWLDLVDVDPATLDPAAVPESAWWVALAQQTYLTPADVPGLYLIPTGIAADPDHPGLYLIPTGGA